MEETEEDDGEDDGVQELDEVEEGCLAILIDCLNHIVCGHNNLLHDHVNDEDEHHENVLTM